jgi:hypothetical protein
VSARLATSVEAAALIRRVERDGDFVTLLRRGDPDRGALLLIVGSRGRHVTCLERLLDFSGAYQWSRVGPAESADSAEVSDFLAKRARFDGDFWAIELDIADPERFIAETTASA